MSFCYYYYYFIKDEIILLIRGDRNKYEAIIVLNMDKFSLMIKHNNKN